MMRIDRSNFSLIQRAPQPERKRSSVGLKQQQATEQTALPFTVPHPFTPLFGSRWVKDPTHLISVESLPTWAEYQNRLPQYQGDRSKALYSVLKNWIQKGLKDGTLEAGKYAWPSHHDLQFHYDVPSITLQKALTHLQRKGWLKVKKNGEPLRIAQPNRADAHKTRQFQQEKALRILQTYLNEPGWQLGQTLPSSRKLLSLLTGKHPHLNEKVVQQALHTLFMEDFLKKAPSGRWVLKRYPPLPPTLDTPAAESPKNSSPSQRLPNEKYIPVGLEDLLSPPRIQHRDKLQGVYQWLKRSIEKGLARGELTPRHLLPASTEIATALNPTVSDEVVLSAYWMLAHGDELIQARKGLGFFIRHPATQIPRASNRIVQTFQVIRQWLTQGNLPPGTALPDLDTLTQQLNISRVYANIALKYFEMQGAIIPNPDYTPGLTAKWFLRQAPKISATAEILHRQDQALVERTANAIRTWIQKASGSGTLRPGDPLPRIKALCQQFNVEPHIIQAARNFLKQEGLIEDAPQEKQSPTWRLKMSSVEPVATTTDSAAEEALLPTS